jgi:hypothetical protein
MATFQSEYETSTNAINSIVTTQLSSVLNWLNVPGTLVKASSSAAGFVWGYNGSSMVYTCQLPCTGNWANIDLSQYQVSNILDLTTDETNVYILYTNAGGAVGLLVTPASNQGTRTTVSVPFSANSIFSTHTYIWAQDASNNKQRCPKPCTMPNWQAATDTTITITSSDNTTLYGKDATGQAMQTNETLQASWQPIGDVKGSIYGKAQDGTLYGIDSTQNAFQYDGKVSSVYTDGLTPTNMTVDSQSSQLWMTTATPGQVGNVFTRSQKPDYSTIMNTITPLDRTRDKIVDSVESRFNRQTDVMTVNKQTNDVVTFFKNMFKIDGDTAKKANNQAGHLNENIRESQKQLDQINNLKPILVGVILILGIVMLVYLTMSYVFMSYVHWIALIVIGGGLLVMNNPSKLNFII